MNLTGSPAAIMQGLLTPEASEALAMARATITRSKNEIDEHEAALLFALAQRFDGGRILELGTALGYSAAVLAQAAPMAQVTTLTPSEKHFAYASQALRVFPNVHCLQLKSWRYLDVYDGPALDMVFVDGYHGMVVWDLPWWNWLKAGGLMLFHDYSPAGAPRATPPVVETVNAFCTALGRGPDVLMQTDQGQGMAGLYKLDKAEKMPFMNGALYSWHFDDESRTWVRGAPQR